LFEYRHCRRNMKTTVYALEALNQAFHTREVDVAEPDAHEVLVEVVASGICHSDLNVVNGTSPAQMPIVLGHEGTGIVKKVGSLIRTVKVGGTISGPRYA
jgi:Zn-dependent alcohol dehydrogenase